MSSKSKSSRENKQCIVGIFDRAAPTYDQVGPSFFSTFGKKLVEFAHIEENDRVLDIATGRGAVLFPAAQAVGMGGTVTGTDLAEAMVNEVRKEVQDRGFKNVRIECMDAENLQFPDAFFDVVLCGFALFFFP